MIVKAIVRIFMICIEEFVFNTHTLCWLPPQLDESTARRHLRSPRSLSAKSSHLIFQGHIWSLEFNRCVCLLFHGNQAIFYWDIAKSICDLEIFKVNIMAKVKPDVPIWCLNFNSYVWFSFRGNRTIFGWDIANSIFGLVKLIAKVTPDNPIEV